MPELPILFSASMVRAIFYCAGESLPPSIRAFRDAWNAENAARGYAWGVNPWVWEIEFRRI